MAITLADDAVVLDSGIRLKFLRDAEYSPAPPLVGLDGETQTLLQCTPDGKLKVDATLEVGMIYPEVDMKGRDATNIGRYMQVDTDPATGRYALIVNDPRLAFDGDKLKVEATIISEGISGESIDAYDEITNQVFAAYHTIVSYTVPVGKTFHLRHVSVSGTNKATFRVLHGAGVILAKKRTYYTNFNEDFFFESDNTLGNLFVAGENIYVDVTHSNAAANGDFNATISGRLENA